MSARPSLAWFDSGPCRSHFHCNRAILCQPGLKGKDVIEKGVTNKCRGVILGIVFGTGELYVCASGRAHGLFCESSLLNRYSAGSIDLPVCPWSMFRIQMFVCIR